MLIRPATLSDIPNILPMVMQICALHESWDNAKYGFLADIVQYYQPWLTKLLNSDRNIFLVAETDNKLTAFLVATVEREIPIYRLQEYGFIHDLWVESEYRNQGIARQMVMLTIKKFTEMGIKQIRLDTTAINDTARKLFINCGFRVSTIQMLIEL